MFALVDELDTRSELFVAPADPGHTWRIDHTDSRPWISELVTFRARAAAQSRRGAAAG